MTRLPARVIANLAKNLILPTSFEAAKHDYLEVFAKCKEDLSRLMDTDIADYDRTGYGAVVSSAIRKYVYVTVNKRFDDDIRISYAKTEGLPNIVLEAMACGATVLATPVGAIPDVIVDGKNGFIMNNDSPSPIADAILAAIDNLDLERISLNSRQFVREMFSFEAACREWRAIVSNFGIQNWR